VIVVRGFAKDFGISGFNFGITVTCNEKIRTNFVKWRQIQEPLSSTCHVVNQLLVKTNFGSEIWKINKKILKKKRLIYVAVI